MEQTYLLKVRGIVIVPVQLGKLVSIAKMLCLNLDPSPMSVQLRPEDGDALWRKALSMVLKYIDLYTIVKKSKYHHGFGLSKSLTTAVHSGRQ